MSDSSQPQAPQGAYAQIITRAWNDPEYRKRLVSDPHAALAEVGVNVPEGTQVKVVENTPALQHLVIPVKPEGGQVEPGIIGARPADGIIGARPADGIIGARPADGIIPPSTEPPSSLP